ncbi:MAG: ABC transporter permease [Candidatus Limiplasma sp.]|nr:ABC transporter permease [Candidatus Limiplasma sp.]
MDLQYNRKKVQISRYAIFLVLVVMLIFFSIVAPGFFSKTTFLNILRQVAVNGIAAVGMTMVILTGGIDISVGSIVGSTSVLCAMMMTTLQIHPVLAVLLTLLFGQLVGLANGFMVYKIKIPPMIATLASLSILRGMAYIFSGGLPIYNLPEGFTVLGQGYFLGIPIPVLIMIACFALGWFVLEHTSYGRYVYGIGSNVESSRLSGINVGKIMVSVYGMCGMLASLAGVVYLSRVNSGQPKGGEGYEMDIITAVVLGGVSTTGGEGKIIRVVVGLLIMGVLMTGMTMMNIQEYYQRVVKGVVLIVAISYDILSLKRADKKV